MTLSRSLLVLLFCCAFSLFGQQATRSRYPQPEVRLAEVRYESAREAAKAYPGELAVFKKFEERSVTRVQMRQWLTLTLADISKKLSTAKVGAEPLLVFLMKHLNADKDVIRIPCYVERARIGKRPGWIVVTNWEMLPPGREATVLGHYFVAVIEAETGEVLATDSCK